MPGPREQLEVDTVEFRATLGSFATGVSIMTTVADGVPHGMTANALTSVSLSPPLVLVCVDRDAIMAERVVSSGVFALSFLAVDQQALSNRFADDARQEGDAEFVDVRHHRAATGSPILEGAVAWVDCRVWSVTDGGDHLVVVGEVVALDYDADADPLLYFRGGYGELRR